MPSSAIILLRSLSFMLQLHLPRVDHAPMDDAPAVTAVRVAADDVDWSNARAQVLVECRSLWIQPKMYGVSIEARDILIYPEDDTCPFSDDDELSKCAVP